MSQAAAGDFGGVTFTPLHACPPCGWPSCAELSIGYVRTVMLDRRMYLCWAHIGAFVDNTKEARPQSESPVGDGV